MKTKVTLSNQSLVAIKWDGTEEGIEEFIEAFPNVRIQLLEKDIDRLHPNATFAIYREDGSLARHIVLVMDRAYVEDYRRGVATYNEQDYANMFTEEKKTVKEA